MAVSVDRLGLFFLVGWGGGRRNNFSPRCVKDLPTPGRRRILEGAAVVGAVFHGPFKLTGTSILLFFGFLKGKLVVDGLHSGDR